MTTKILNRSNPYRCNCVKFVRTFCPSMPHGLFFLWQKKRIMNFDLALKGGIAIMDVGRPWGHVGVVKGTVGNQVLILEANYISCAVTERLGTEKELNIKGYYYSNLTMTIEELKKQLAKDFVRKDKRFYFEPNGGGIRIIGRGKRYHVGDEKDDFRIMTSGICGNVMTKKQRDLPRAKSREEVL